MASHSSLKHIHFVLSIMLCMIPLTQMTAADTLSDIEKELFFSEHTNPLDFSYTRMTNDTPIVYEVLNTKDRQQALAEKDWTFIVYIAADNDLRNFSTANIKQMTRIGSNEHINIYVHIDIRLTGSHKITRRYYIEKNKITCINADDPSSQQMNSGDPKTLISCCKDAIEHYPAKHYALVLWNHGTGPIDPGNPKIINPSELFMFNPATCKLELDRSIGFLDLINQNADMLRGVCWDDSTGQYLTNQKLDSALNDICSNILRGKKLAIIAFDACLMSTLEIANLVKNYADITVGSQEVELGTGWNYELVLEPFERMSLTSHEFAQHIVRAYAKNYHHITDDYTQSAIALEQFEKLNKNVNHVAQLLIECISKQQNNSVRNAIRASRNKFLCTHFNEPSYIDLHHFYGNLYDNLYHFILNDHDLGATLKNKLAHKLQRGADIIKHLVVANQTGKNLQRAQGVSIYFPERGYVHPSYPPASFAQNAWISFLRTYLAS